jgi:hypothetical protein
MVWIRHGNEELAMKTSTEKEADKPPQEFKRERASDELQANET